MTVMLNSFNTESDGSHYSCSDGSLFSFSYLKHSYNIDSNVGVFDIS